MDENRSTIILGNLHINQEFIKLNEFHGAGSATDAVLLVGAESAYTPDQIHDLGAWYVPIASKAGGSM
jgi:hypothetical protein